MTKILICTVGLPRSGKSSWSLEQSCPIVNPDSIRLAIHGKSFYGPAEPLVWATAKLMVRSLFIVGHNFVILDATNITKARRDEWQSRDWKTYFYYINTPMNICIERTNDPDLIGAIQRMAKDFECLKPDELVFKS